MASPNRCVASFLRVLLAGVLVVAGAAAQAVTKEQFRTEFTKGLEFADQKMMDGVLKKDRGASEAALYFEDLYREQVRGKDDLAPKTEALRASWARCFSGSTTLDKLARWIDNVRQAEFEMVTKSRNTSSRLWGEFSALPTPSHDDCLRYMKSFVEMANRALEIGHMIEASDLWSMASVVGGRAPEKSLDDRKEILHCIEQFVTTRESWDFTFDRHFLQNREYVKIERERIAEAGKAAEKRANEGYGGNVKGIDALVMPGAKADVHNLDFEAQKSLDELDYGPKNGPVPALWWNVNCGKDGTAARIDWFRRSELYLSRPSASKFGIALDAADLKKVVEVDVSGKGKVSQFWLDAEKKQPYAMFFWTGSDREKIGEAECNLAVTPEAANVYYRSAAAWKTSVGSETLVFYDDNCSGWPGDLPPNDPPIRIGTLGDPVGDGTPVPMLDSMRIGKGPRQPFSKFVRLATGWFHLEVDKQQIGLRPLNPEYNKLGKIKLVWSGPKPTAPVQLVVQGAGDYATALFDVAGGKEVEVPAGEYSVVFGRIVIGKGARCQSAALYAGASKPFAVEAGKVHELKMGAPYSLHFDREGDEHASVDAGKVLLHEASGCVLADLQGLGVYPEVLAAKAEDGKGATVVGKFVPFADAELVNAASKHCRRLGILAALLPMPEGYRDGVLALKVKMPAAGYKMGLQVKKHALFGAIGSSWK
jgi:hypothetical protein